MKTYNYQNYFNIFNLKFDLILGNPPFNGGMDLDFLSKSYDIGDYILFVHPSTWIIDEKNKQKKFIDIKNKIGNHLEKVIFFNGNGIFNINLFVPCVITTINKKNTNKKIHCLDKINNVCVDYISVDNINKFNDIRYLNIKNKIQNLVLDNIDNHKIFNTSTKRNNTLDKIKKYSHLNTTSDFYINMAQIRGNVSLKMVSDDFYTIITRDTVVERNITKHMFFSFLTENEANNCLNFLKTNFVRFCLSVYKNNSQLECGEMGLIPWLDFTQEWTDEKLKEYFELTEEEVQFIEKVIPKYY